MWGPPGPAKLSNRAAITFGALVFSTCVAVFALQEGQAVQYEENDPGQDAICGNCHRDIYDRYRQTPMAQGSGPALDGVVQGEFTHLPSEVHYSVFVKDGKVWMSYLRTKQLSSGRNSQLRGERELKYFIGSGHRGSTYLYEESGLWFQTPINYYSKGGVWDMAPGYGSSPTMPGVCLWIQTVCIVMQPASGPRCLLPGTTSLVSLLRRAVWAVQPATATEPSISSNRVAARLSTPLNSHQNGETACVYSVISKAM